MEHSEEIARRKSAGLGAVRAFEQVRKELLSEFGAEYFRSYVDPMKLVAEWNGVLLFRAGSSVAQERLRERQHRIEARMRAHMPDLDRIDILLDREIPEDVRAVVAAQAEEAESRVEAPAPHPLSYTFDSFCVDQSNYRAFTVAQMIATGAGMAFPVWLLHSAPGRGKTHLLHAIAHESALRTPTRKVLLMTGQEFLENFQSALHKKRDAHAFKDVVRAPDLLLIDDFQRICGKKSTEEEAYDTISILTARGRQVVITADHGAEGLEGMDERLRRALKGATACEIDEPNTALRRKILDMRVKHYARVTPGFAVAPAALDLIAERMPVSGRELDGAVSQLVIEAKISGGMEVSVEVAVNALQGKLADATERRITVQVVQKVVARHFGMTVPGLLERTRRHAIARPRQIAMYLATQMTSASLPDIGARFGGFDHTTIMYSRDRIAELLQEDLKLRTEVETLIKLIRREP